MKKQIFEKIKEYNTIILHGHNRPDGDCYGAAFGLKYLIENTYPEKKVYSVGEATSFYDYVGYKDQIEDDVYNDALVIVVDTAIQTRISDDRWQKGKYIIKIDHHIPVDDYGDIQWVDTSYPACSLMVTELINDFKEELKMCKKSAVALYTGIVTDTGNFIYRGVGAKTMLLAATLLDYGIEIYDDVMKYINMRTIEKVKFQGYVCNNFETTENGFAYIKLPLSLQEEYGVTQEIAASNVGMLSDIEGIKAWGVFIEYPNTDIIRGRIRSSSLVINEIANKYDGGGHKFACGTNHTSWNNIDQFVSEIDKLCK